MQQKFPEALLNLALWDQLAAGQCEEVAYSVMKELPPKFRFIGVKRYTAGDQQRYIASFEWRESTQSALSTFSLIPGGTVSLGFDRAQLSSLVPDAELVCEWQESNLYFHGNSVTMDGALIRDILPPNYQALYQELDRVLLPRRTVTIQPFLLETIARSPQEIDPSLCYKEEVRGRMKFVRRTRYPPMSHDSVVQLFGQQGFRLLASDEWEYACAAGSQTLFYWGNGVFDSSQKSVQKPSPYNAFGLDIANGPYNWEFCAEEGLMRGGDGGISACGGCGLLAMYLTCASAYISMLDEQDIGREIYYAHARRTYPLLQGSY